MKGTPMDRAKAARWLDRTEADLGLAEEYVLPSRADAISALASAIERRGGPVLLTGEPGVGKTWLVDRLVETFPASWRWVSIDLSPAIAEADLHRLIVHALGVEVSGDPTEARARLSTLLAESAADGFSCALILDEGQNASAGLLEELRVLGNRLGDASAFAGLVLVGQTALGQRMTTRAFAALQSRFEAKVHLKPLGVDEFKIWLGQFDPEHEWDEEVVELLHRDCSGNPRKIRQAIQVRPQSPSALPNRPESFSAMPARPKGVEVAPQEPPVSARLPDYEVAPIAAGKPPLRMSEGMIEVGWEPTEASEPDDEASDLNRTSSRRSLATADRLADASTPAQGVEVINDHYAALQAWTEWAHSQGREPLTNSPQGESSTLDESRLPVPGTSAELDPDEDPSARLSGHSGVRAEAQHEFAPYSQLFSRLRQARDPQ